MKKILLTSLGFALCISASAGDYIEDFSFEHEGQTLNYSALAGWSLSCSTKPGSYTGDIRWIEDYNPHNYLPGNLVSGDLIIPSKAGSYVVTQIGPSSFHTNGLLTSVVIPNTVTEIGGGAFLGCDQLTSIVLPSSLTDIGMFAFYECTGLQKIVSYATTPPDAGEDAFFRVKSNIEVYVPKGCKEEYAKAYEWKRFYKIIEMEDLTSIDEVTADCSNDIDFEATYDVYNLSGLHVAYSIDGLAPGIYIICQNDKVKKFVVK